MNESSILVMHMTIIPILQLHWFLRPLPLVFPTTVTTKFSAASVLKFTGVWHFWPTVVNKAQAAPVEPEVESKGGHEIPFSVLRQMVAVD